MAQLRLVHLTFIGQGRDPATVEFGPDLTLIRGPSDTGKSFIVHSIDFMLGASELKEIPERMGYTDVLLGIELQDGNTVTLARGVGGGSFSLYQGDLRTGPLSLPGSTLAAKHSATSETNLSRMLLGAIGLDGKVVRKNAQNVTTSVSFRDIAHLTVVDETQMQSETSPALTGSYVTKTREVSVLKLILEDADDSALTPTASVSDVKKLTTAKSEVIDGLIASLEEQLRDSEGVDEVRSQRAKLAKAISDTTASLKTATARRDGISENRLRAQKRVRLIGLRLSEVETLQKRFGLLEEQYRSDLARLGMIQEAGNLLGYFTPGVCPFCGAEAEHQHLHSGNLELETAFAESVRAEIEKTALLLDDLQLSRRDLADQRSSYEQAAEVGARILTENSLALAEAERLILPNRTDMKSLLDARSEVERILGLYNQVAELQKLKAQISDEATTDAAGSAAAMDLRVLREFSEEISVRLAAWGYPAAATVSYDRSSQDVISGDQLRSAHGKGVRSILHAAFTTGLAQYCFDRELPHPGFVVLDSPLVTYRAPDADEDSGPDTGVAASFYADMQTNFHGQIIVMENVDPPEALVATSVDIVFTGVEGVGRTGFFPVRH